MDLPAESIRVKPQPNCQMNNEHSTTEPLDGVTYFFTNAQVHVSCMTLLCDGNNKIDNYLLGLE